MKTEYLIRLLAPIILFSLLLGSCAQPVGTSVPGPIATSDAASPTSTPLVGPLLPTQTSSAAANITPTLENTPWILRDLATDGLKPLLAVYSVTLQFNPADSTASGRSACNRYSGTYSVKDNTLSFGPLMSTMMACTELPSAVESAYQPVLGKVASYQITGHSLMLYDGNQTMLLRFEVDPFSRATAFTYEELANATYHSPFVGGDTVTLKNGEYRDETSGSTLVLSNYAAFGDITGDGQEDAVLVLIAAGSGTGTFYYLTVVQHQGDQWSDAQTLIGDRVRLSSLQIAGNQIAVDMLVAGPDDPQCCPTTQTIQRYRWAGTQLELLDLLESR